MNLAETPTIGPNPAHQFIITQVYSGLIINIMFAFFGGVLFTSPFAIYSLLGFLDKRKRFASRLGPIGPDDLNHWQLNRPGWNKNPAILLSIPLLTACWILGVIIAYLVTLPITFHLLFDYTPIFVENYMPTMGKLALLTGLVFEIPAFLFLLTASNLVEWKKIRKWWAAALLLSVIVAVLMTPSLDLLSVTIATLFIFGLYWLGIMVAWIGSKKYSEKPAEEIGK